MTRRDKWKSPPRPSVARYRAFADECRLKIKQELDGAEVVFFISMPASWSDGKRKDMLGRPHKQRPDLSNLIKALEDALYGDDAAISSYSGLRKVWAADGKIVINGRE